MKFGLREVLSVALLMCIPLGAWWFVFRPRSAQISELREQMQAKRAKLSALNRAQANIEDLQGEIDQYNEAINFFQNKLPPEKEIDKVLREVWNLARASNLTTKSIRTMKRAGSRAVTIAEKGGPYAEQPISLELVGDFKHGLYNFLLALEKRPRITRIQELKVSKLNTADAVEGEVHAEIVMSIFFERGPLED